MQEMQQRQASLSAEPAHAPGEEAERDTPGRASYSADRSLDATETSDAILRTMQEMQQRQADDSLSDSSAQLANAGAEAEGTQRLERQGEEQGNPQAAEMEQPEQVRPRPVLGDSRQVGRTGTCARPPHHRRTQCRTSSRTALAPASLPLRRPLSSPHQHGLPTARYGCAEC
jgi:hypothetical protein